MTRVYISGPVTNQPDNNRDAFDYAERLHREIGYEVFNPQTIAEPSKEEVEEWINLYGIAEYSQVLWRYYMRVCVGQIPLCDEMYMLANWQNSKGAVWEHRIAYMLGLKITYAPVL